MKPESKENNKDQMDLLLKQIDNYDNRIRTLLNEMDEIHDKDLDMYSRKNDLYEKYMKERSRIIGQYYRILEYIINENTVSK